VGGARGRGDGARGFHAQPSRAVTARPGRGEEGATHQRLVHLLKRAHAVLERVRHRKQRVDLGAREGEEVVQVAALDGAGVQLPRERVRRAAARGSSARQQGTSSCRARARCGEARARGPQNNDRHF